MFNEVVKSEIIPDQFTVSTIVLQHKNEDKENINNYRPIILMLNTYKVLAKVILNSITR